MQPPIYPPDMVQPFRDELVAVGFKELTTAEDVDQAVSQKGTTFCMINSVCGCAAGSARPGVGLALTILHLYKDRHCAATRWRSL